MVYNVEQFVEFIGGEIDLFVVIEVIHFLNLAEEGISESGVHDRRDLQQEVEFLDEVLSEGEVGACHVVFYDIVESAVGGVR